MSTIDRLGIPACALRQSTKFTPRSCRAVASFKYQFPGDKFSPGSAGTPRSRDPYGNGDRSSESSLRVETSREGQPSYPLFSSIFRVAVPSVPFSAGYINRRKVESFFAFAYYSFIRSVDGDSRHPAILARKSAALFRVDERPGPNLSRDTERRFCFISLGMFS